MGIFEQVAEKSGICGSAAQLFSSGGNLAAEVEMEYNHTFANDAITSKAKNLGLKQHTGGLKAVGIRTKRMPAKK